MRTIKEAATQTTTERFGAEQNNASHNSNEIKKIAAMAKIAKFQDFNRMKQKFNNQTCKTEATN